MPRKAPWPPPIYERGGKDVVRLTIAPRKYREVTLGPAGSAEAKQEYARIIAEIEHHGSTVERVADLTVVELCDRYLRQMEESQEPRSYGRAVRALGGVCDLYGRRPAVEFGPVALSTVREAWVGEGLSRRYINHLTNSVKQCWRWAVASEILPGDRAHALAALPGLRKRKTKAKETAPIRPPDLGQVTAVLAALPPILADFCRLLQATGARPGELLALRPCDLVRGWKVVDGVELWLYRLDSHKTDWRGHHRWIPLGPRAQGILARYLERAKDRYCFSPREVAAWAARERKAKPRRGGERLPGERYTTQVLDRAILRACLCAYPPPAGLSGEAIAAWEQEHSWRPNQLRHLVGTQVETEYGREDARCVLGHRSPSTTAIYAESVDRAAIVIAKIG